jgi:DNA-binding NarL/FixJ family response regulator
VAVITVLVVDDHPVVRVGLQTLLAEVDDLDVVGIAADGNEAINLAHALEPDVVLMDLSMPGIGGVAATRAILASRPATRVLVLTSFADRNSLLDALDAGAAGYALKDADTAQLVTQIRAVAEGCHAIDARMAGVLLDVRSPAPSEQLTDREHDVLRLVAQGFANKQIARHLSIREATVKRHLTHTYQRIGVTDRTQAAIWALANLPS